MDYTANKPPSCRECPLWRAPGPVFAEGDPHAAKLVYIGQNPGREEVSATPMRPFVGAAGRVRNRQLFEAGIAHRELYTLNQVKCLTPENRMPTRQEIECCRPLLQKELDFTRADTVLLAGELAFKENIGSYSTLGARYKPTDSIMARMGCVEQRHGRKWIGTIHPAFVMRMPEWQRAAVDQLQKAWCVAGLEVPLPKTIEHPEPADIERHRVAARKNKAFADDVETLQVGVDIDEDDYVGADWDVDICGFSAIYYEAIILNKSQLAAEWSEVWADPEIMQCEHNGEYEWYHLSKIAPQRNRRWDTMHAFHYLRNWHASGGSEKKKKSGTRLALKPATLSIFTNLPYYDRSVEQALGRRFYCGLDNITTLLAAREQWRQMRNK